MFDTSNAGSDSSFAVQGAVAWQSKWVEALWEQLNDGTYSGIGSVVVDENISQTEVQVLADLDAIDRMLGNNSSISGLINEIQQFAGNNEFNPGVDPVTGSEITPPTESLAQVMQYVHQQGLPDLIVEIDELKLDDIAEAGDKGDLKVIVRNQGGLKTKHPVTVKVYASESGQLDDTAIEIGERSWNQLNLKPNKEKKTKIKLELPESLPSGDYRLFAVVDVTGQVPEADETNNVTAVSDLQQIIGTQPPSPEPPTSELPFAILAEGKVTINGNSDLDGNPLLLEDDALLYGGEGFKLNGQPVLPIQRNADGSPVVDADGQPVLVDRAVAVSADYKEAKVSNNQYGNILPPQVVETEIVTVPDHDTVVAATLAAQVPAGVTPTAFDLRGVPLYNQQKWNENFPVGGTPEQPVVIRIIGGKLTIPNEVDLENIVVIVENGDINFNGQGHQLSNVTLVAENGSVRLSAITGTDVSVLATKDITVNSSAVFSGQSLIGTQKSVKFDSNTTATYADPDEKLQVIAQKDITVNGQSDMRAEFLAGGNFKFNSNATLRGSISVKGDITFNGQTTVYAVPETSSDEVAPVISLSLQTDTGNDSDGVTSVAEIVGTVTDDSAIVSLKAGFGDTPFADFVDISAYLQGDTLTLNAAALESISGSALSDGSYTLNVIAEDSLGNVSEPVSYSYVLDTQSPTLDVTELKTVDTEDGFIRLIGSVDEPSVVTVTLVGQETITFAVPVAGAFEQSLQAVPTDVGEYALGVSLADAAGNAAQVSLSFNVTPSDVDAPVVMLSILDDTGENDDRVTSVATVVGTVADESNIVSLRAGFGDTPIAEFVDISEYLQDGSFTLDATALESVFGAALTDGSYTLQVIAEDSFGNISEPVSSSYILDTQAPALTVTELKTVETEDGLIRLLGSVDEAASATVTIVGQEPITFEITEAGSFEQALQSIPSEAGDYALEVSLTDAAGNSRTSTLTFTVEPVDTQAPIVTLSLLEDTGNASDNISANGAIVGTVTEDGDIVSVKAGFGDTEIADFVDISAYLQDSNFTLDTAALETVLGTSLSDGSYTLNVIAEDSLGNVSTPVSYSYTLDTTSPTLTLITPIEAGDHSGYVHLIGSVDEAVTVSTTLEGDEAVSFTVASAGEFDELLQSLPLSIGAHQLAVTITDGAGNTAQETVDFEVSETAFETGPVAATGWAAATSDSLILGESDSYAVQATLPVNLGQSEGSRTLRFAINTAFDKSDENTTTEDRFAVYLVDAANPSQTLLDNGVAGTPVFGLSGETAEFTPGLVTYDGRYVEIDLTELDGQTQGQLIFQMLNQDSDTGSRVSINGITNEVDLEGTEGLRFPIDTYIAPIGNALDIDTLSANADISALFSNVRFNAETGEYTAELRLRNNSDISINRQAAVVFSDLPDGVSLVTTSGIDANGNGYVSLQDAIRPGGLQSGAISDGIAITFSNPEQLRLSLTPEVLAGGPNQSPVFPDLGPLTVMPGRKLEIPLTATDPDGDRVTYSIRSNGDLPKGALNGSGKLIFEPTPDQIGTYEFTLIATDGAAETSQQISLTVEPDPDTTTRISGRILDTEGNPLAGLPLALGRLQVQTDDEGYFTLVVPQTSFPTEEIDIAIPLGDLSFDPFFTGTSEIDLRRTTFDGATGTGVSNPLRHPNLVSTFMDASMVYGNDASRASALRTNDGSGHLKVSDGNLLPVNNSEFFPDGALTNNNRGLTDPATLFATGDVRANENIGLTAMHTVFVREHNRLADELSAANPELSGEDIYQRARKLVAAQIQYITYSEYLPLLIGDNTIADYAGYDAEIDPSVSHLFSAAAFRMGHTQSSDEFLLIGDDGQPLPSASLNESTFNPTLVQEYGVDAILRGLFAQPAEAIDTKVIDELRNTLFGPPGAGGIDLAAVDIQRGRDVGLPDYNQARVDFGLPPVTSFAEITSDVELQAVLEQVYGSVDDIDAIVGGLAEDAVSGSMVGELFQTVIADQFARLRDGDRFWYENGQFTADELDVVRGTSLSALLERNTEITGLADNLFSTGRDPALLAESGTVAAQTTTEYSSLDGSNNNLANPELGMAGTNLRVDYTQEYGDDIRSLAGEDRANVREISNAIFTQDESIPDETGATSFMLVWSQFMGHDMTFAPAGAADTLKVYGNELGSENDAPDNSEEFPFVAEKLNLLLGHEVYAGVDNVIDRPIYLPALAVDDNVQTVDGSGDITVTNAALGAQVFVKADSLSDNRGNPFTGQLSITEVPTDLTPAALPDNLSPDLVVTIQPGDMVFSEPALLTLPNRAGWAAGTLMDLWSINPTTGEFEIVGKGQVSEDGALVETIEGGIRNSSWHMLVPGPAIPTATPRNLNDECEECLERHSFTSTVESHSGAVIETHDLVSYQSQGQSRSIRLTYDSLRADPSPIVHTAFESIETRGNTFLISKLTLKQGDFEYRVPGYDGSAYGLEGGEHFWRVPNGDSQYSTAMQANLRDLASGAYTYEVESGFYLLNEGEFAGSSVTTSDRLIHVNSSDSVLGSGWGIAGVQELIENPDGSVLLIDGDGSDILFEASTTNFGEFESPESDYSILVKLADGTFQRTLKNQSVFKFDSNNRLVSVTDRNQNVTQHIYEEERLISIVDSVGLSTDFSYQDGRISEISDPAGRVTKLKYDESGNLFKIMDPGDSNRVFEYDDNHHMTAETDQRGHREEAFYDFSGRASHAVRKDGSVARINPVQVQGLYRSELTSKISTAPVIVERTTNANSHYADGNGNVTLTLLDDSGRKITSLDGKGLNPVITRDENYLVQRTKSVRGFETSYEYDDFGNVAKITYPGSNTIDPETAPVIDSLTFEDWTQLSNSDSGTIRIADVNNDGRDDIVTESGRVYLGLDNDTLFQLDSDSSNIDYLDKSFFLSDINGDAVLDLIDSGRVYYGLGSGSFLFAESRENMLTGGTLIGTGDFDNDGDIDIVEHGGGYALEVFRISLNDGNGNFESSFEYSGFVGPESINAVVKDVDRDGNLDFVVSAPYLGAQIYFGNGNGEFSESTVASDSSYNTNIVATDLNSDGLNDLIIGQEIFINTDGTNFVRNTDIVSLPSNDSRVTAADDVDGDGDTDLLVIDESTFPDGLFVLLNDGNDIFDESIEVTVDILPFPEQLLVADFNGDAKKDLLTFGYEFDAGIFVSYNDSDVSGGIPTVTEGVTRSYTYDPIFNQVTSITDELGRQTLYEINSVGNRTSEIRVVGELDSAINGETDDVVMTYSYTAAGQIDIQTDALGRKTDYDYNRRGLLESITFAKGTDVEATQTFEYDEAGNQTAAIDENGNRTEYIYDEMNRQVQVIHTDPDGDGELESPTTFVFYDKHGNVTSQIDANGNTSTNKYDKMGRLISTKDALGHMTKREYDARGNIVLVTDALKRETESIYDTRGRLIATIRPDDSVVKIGYDADNNRMQSLDANGNASKTDYDARGRVSQVTDALGNVTKYEYDAAGQMTAQIDANQDRTKYTYDELGRRISVEDALGNITRTEYDKAGRITAQVDALGKATRYEYDDRDRRTAILAPIDSINPVSSITTTTYDAAGNVLSITDAVSNTTTYVYDGLNRLIEETNELEATRYYRYDAQSNRIAAIDRNGREKAFLYDKLNRQVEEQWLDDLGSVIRSTTFVYDAAGQMTEVSDPDSTYHYTYDLLGRQQTVDNKGTAGVPNVVLIYDYDKAGNLTSVTDKIDGTVGGVNAYRYDELNRVKQITQSGDGITNKRVDFTYSPVGQFKSIDRYSDLEGASPVVTTTYEYDESNRLERLSHSNNTEEVAFYDYTYDSASRITSITDIDGTNAYSYNSRDELTGAAHSDSSNPDESYSYDANGNRVSSAVHGSDYVTGGNNQLMADGVYTYEYDDEGNMTRQTKTATGEVRTFEWDYRNRLIGVVDRDVVGVELLRVAYSYDALGRRIAKVVDTDGTGSAEAQTLRFVYDRDDVLLEFEGDSKVASQRYLHGPQVDQVLAQEDEGIEMLWHLSDHLGTVKDLAGDNGAVVNHRAYDSYGNLVEQSNNTFDSRYAFTGRELDQETDLSYHRARYYNSQNGKFISQDPIGFNAGDTNVYRYVFNRPTDFSDPSGEKVYVGFRYALPLPKGVHTSLILVPDHPEDFSDESFFRTGPVSSSGERYMILSAFPEKEPWDPTPPGSSPCFGEYGRLLFEPNNMTDEIGNLINKVEISSPHGESDTAFIRELIRSARSYDNQAFYDPLSASQSYLNRDSPGSGRSPQRIHFPTYNSNSFVSGLLAASNVPRPSLTSTRMVGGSRISKTDTYWAPLYDHPLPL